jgi:hypothetical protein
MKLKNSKYLFVIFFIAAMISYSRTASAQSSNPEDEKIKSDALAMAYITCDYDLTKYYFNLNKDNDKLRRDLQQATLLKGLLTISMEIKYRDDERLKLKYQREIEPAKKKLGKCIKYQGILDSQAKIEKEKEKENDNADK